MVCNSEIREQIIRYYEKLQEISRLQNKLALFTNNKHSIQQSIEDIRCEAPGAAFENLRQELFGLQAEIINTNLAIWKAQYEITDMHFALEQLSAEERRFVELCYREGRTLAFLSVSLCLSTATVSRYRVKMINKIAAMLQSSKA